MLVVQPPKPRYTIADQGDRLKIIIPGRRPILGIVASVVIVLILVFMLRALAAENQLAEVPWLVILVLAGAVFFFSYNLLGNVIGREVIVVEAQRLSVRYEVVSVGRTREYLAEHILDLRALSELQPALRLQHAMFSPWGLKVYSMAFDYGARTYYLGSGATEAEAKQIVAAIKNRFPPYRSTLVM
jgi:hypothetical protein